MRSEDNLLDKIGRRHGMKVEDGYFDEFVSKVMSRLPEYPEKPVYKPLTRWQRVKPYVYMAAMFAGIWCMMKMFHIASENASNANLDNPPEVIAHVIESDEAFDYLLTSEDDVRQSELEIVSEVSEDYVDISEFERDFGYELMPEYREMNVDV